jgi:hypothetical protein
MLDIDWLVDFRNGKVIITPGNALVCRVSYSYGYDQHGVLQTVKHDVVKVLRIVHGHEEQTSLLD